MDKDVTEQIPRCNGAAPGTIGLKYVSDQEPGITRIRRGRGFSYHLPGGDLLRDEEHLMRVRALGIPPAYSDVWFCLSADGHLQATGLDARGRKQYRYHADWLTFRDRTKFDQLLPFGNALPRIRNRVRTDLKGAADRERTVLAALCVLLDKAHLRVGNQVYADENGSFGATTLLKRHVRITGDRLQLSFTAKGGKRVRRSVKHATLSRQLEKISDLPGRQLFVWRGEDDRLRPVDSGRLNAYLADVSGLDITAKTFRTWAGSVAAFDLARQRVADGTRPSIKAMSEEAAAVLFNTPAICRSSYIHPAIVRLADPETAVDEDWFVSASGVEKRLKKAESLMLDFLKTG
ncbi:MULTISPECIES: DNA topoisomerase IB [unclassified Roseibium]|uniref:DNA topoisomerase IB n=1 Tax=unclassified Roseibium TaxID=2629323 RepID=UPI00273E1CEB|nr:MULTISPECIES: DNA topoisomerase IB [unclassified Roseibium]